MRSLNQLSDDEEEDEELKSNIDMQSVVEETCFEDYIERFEPKKHRRDLLLYIAPLLRKG